MIRRILPVVLLVLMCPAADDEKGYLGIQFKLEDGKIKIMAVIGDSPAEKAGLKEGDIIEKLGEVVPTDLHMFVDEVGRIRPGEKVVIIVTRDGKEKKLVATLGKRP